MIRHFGWIIVVVAFAAFAPGAASGIEDRRPNRIADEPIVARRLLDAVLNWRKSLP